MGVKFANHDRLMKAENKTMSAAETNRQGIHTMEVLVVVAFPHLHTAISEEAWEQDIVDAVSAAVYADKTLDTIDVRRLDYEDCEWVLEGGTPLPDYGVTVFPSGSWHSKAESFCVDKFKASGPDLQSLFDYLVEKGRIKK